MRAHLRIAAALLLALACATPPRPTREMLRLNSNPRATVEGRVVDRSGASVAGIHVQGLPRGRDIPWTPSAKTDAEGRFRLTLAAPAEYGFLLIWNGRSIVTPDPADPARLTVTVAPGEHRKGVEVLFLREEWEKVR